MEIVLQENSEKTKRLQMPSGFIIANEIDVTRCDTLKSNSEEFSSPCSILVNHDASDFPDFLKAPGRYGLV